MRVDGSNMVGKKRIEKKDLTKYPTGFQCPVLRYQVSRKSGLAVKINEKNYTEEGHARFAELFGSDGRKNVVEEKVAEVVMNPEECEEKVEKVVEEVVEEKVEEVVEEVMEEKPVNESNHDSGNDQVLSDIELSELDEDDYDDEDDAEAFDVTLNAFADEDTGYYKTKDEDYIYNQDGDCVGEMMDGEFVQGEYS